MKSMRGLFGFKLAAACVLGASLGFGRLSHAECLFESPAEINLGRYNPAAAAWHITAVELRMASLGGCSGMLQLELDAATGGVLLQGGTGAPLVLALSKDSLGVSELPGRPQDVVAVGMAQDGLTSFQFWVLAAPGQWHAPGLYQGQLPVLMVDASGQVLTRRDISVRAYIESVLKVDFSSDSGRSIGSAIGLPFGEMRTGAKQHAAVTVRANSHYEFAVTSLNGGLLMHESGSGIGVPYRTSIDGMVLPSGGRVTFPTAAGTQVQHLMEFTIGSMEQVWSGRYKDTVTVQITAR